MSRHDDIVVTGAGVACRLGSDLDAITALLRAGEAPPFDVWEAAVDAGCGCHLLGRYPGELDDEALGISRSEGRFMGRATRLALVAARAALEASGVDRQGLAVVVGSGTGDVDAHVEIQGTLDRASARRVRPTMIPRLMASTVSANLVNVLRTTGPSLSVSAACAGGAWNLVVAAQLVQAGAAPAALAGGVEVADLHFYSGFDAMRAFNRADNEHPGRASRPYAADRSGFVFGEGAGLVVLERRDHAEARGAAILGTLRGWGASSDGDGEMVAPSAAGARAAMEACLSQAGLTAGDIDYVNTHATSTPAGDVSEARAVTELLGPVRYSSTKGYTGHTISGAGAIEAVFTLRMLQEGFVAPALHAVPLDPALAEAPPVVAPTEAALRIALSNSFGFGGTNVCLALQR